MKKKGFDRPMGEIMHIIDGEAIVHPLSPFRAPRSKVLLENKEVIGVLREPFGPTARPFQAIKLTDPSNTEVIGKAVFARLINKKKKRKRYYNKSQKN